MNRRLFAAGAAAMIPATVAGQEATPTDNTTEAILRYLLDDVIKGGDYAGLADVAGDVDPNTLIEDMANLHGYATRGVNVKMISSDGYQAMAYAIITDTSGQDYDLFLYVTGTTFNTLHSYRWCTGWGD